LDLARIATEEQRVRANRVTLSEVSHPILSPQAAQAPHGAAATPRGAAATPVAKIEAASSLRSQQEAAFSDLAVEVKCPDTPGDRHPDSTTCGVAAFGAAVSPSGAAVSPSEASVSPSEASVSPSGVAVSTRTHLKRSTKDKLKLDSCSLEVVNFNEDRDGSIPNATLVTAATKGSLATKDVTEMMKDAAYDKTLYAAVAGDFDESMEFAVEEEKSQSYTCLKEPGMDAECFLG
jgi:hypothetical protein